MSTKSFDTFIKLMMMTTSDNDPEALVALRKAQATLASQNMNWEELLRARVKFVNVTEGASETKSAGTSGRRYANPEEIDPMFDKLLQEVDPESSFWEFISSVHQWWEEKGFLTEKQYNAIKRSYDRSAA